MATHHNILVVVPDLMMRQRIVGALQALGYPVQGVAKPSIVCNLLEQTAASTILVEIDGIGIDGPELVATLLADPHRAGAPVIGFCAHTRTDLIEAARAAGADRVVSRGQLMRCLDQIMDETIGPPTRPDAEADAEVGSAT